MFWIVLGVILLGFIIMILFSASLKLFDQKLIDDYTELHSGDEYE